MGRRRDNNRVNGDAVFELRRKKVYPRPMLAKKSGVSEHTIMRIENDPNYEPRHATIARLAEALGVEFEDLLEDDNPLGHLGASARNGSRHLRGPS